MKILGFSLMLLVLCLAFSSDTAPSVSYVIAYANAWVSSSGNSVYVSASAGSDGIELGGYTMKCTGKSNLSSRFVGSASPYHSNKLNPRQHGVGESSIGGRGYDGKGRQDYKRKEAE